MLTGDLCAQLLFAVFWRKLTLDILHFLFIFLFMLLTASSRPGLTLAESLRPFILHDATSSLQAGGGDTVLTVTGVVVEVFS